MTELAPCPFCGGPAQISSNGSIIDHYGRCRHCGARQMGQLSEDEAIAAWNRRVAPANVSGLVERRREEAVTAKTALLALIDELNAKCPFGYHDGPYPYREMGMLHGDEAERMIDTLLKAALVCDRAYRAEAPAPAR